MNASILKRTFTSLLLNGLFINGLALSNAAAETLYDLEICSQDSSTLALCQELYSLEPRPTRNPNLYRFTDPRLQDPQWIPLLLQRAMDPSTPEPVVLALLTAVQKPELLQFSEQIPRFMENSNPQIVLASIELLPFIAPSVQEQQIAKLSQDENEFIRREVLRVIARHLGTEYANTLKNGLLDTSADVRFQAIKGIGWNDIPMTIEELTPFLSDSSDEVRVQTLRTMDRLYPGALLKQPIYPTLLEDPSEQVQREILRITKAH